MMRWRLSSQAALTVRAYGLDTLGTGRSGIMFGRLRRLRHRLRLPLRSVIERYNFNFTFLILIDRAIDAIAKTKLLTRVIIWLCCWRVILMLLIGVFI